MEAYPEGPANPSLHPLLFPGPVFLAGGWVGQAVGFLGCLEQVFPNRQCLAIQGPLVVGPNYRR